MTCCLHPRDELLDLLPELAVDRQIDEEVADVVDEVDVGNVTWQAWVVDDNSKRQETDDVDRHDADELRHDNFVTFILD